MLEILLSIEYWLLQLRTAAIRHLCNQRVFITEYSRVHSWATGPLVTCSKQMQLRLVGTLNIPTKAKLIGTLPIDNIIPETDGLSN